jgi:hypothetical protein
MELRHREIYQSGVRARIAAIAAETGATFAALERNSDATARHFARWRAEKPPVFVDTRRMISSCLLVATNSNP